ncbi:DNA polymerase III subunit beta [Mycoplasmopsis gallopavonis]|uniref:DNA polymerase III, beta subunit n=1 Tax=Mycoplasmopsis gallopavonis TaxID=76629 RepID=A0A449AZK4_9BACT|nr:DNA polymerase III subunit beta [Mycoplasmopsis gallopavonis]RIV16252.1 hypothetical protein D1113_03065 [Mycoplasmopsis gallopavonis]VEU72628.1 DNA polymerase III, beta subunit [Mycoplasmopsis gallopavonis]VEU72979.1 DNA polymerase III, beta subunit [Mycoplasmopsis gallopavonis]
MKFSIKKKIIEPIIDFIYSYIDTADTSPSGKSIGIEINSDSLKLIVNNTSFGVKKELEIDETNIMLERNGRTIINASILKNIIKKFDRIITFELVGETVVIYEGSTKFEIATIDDQRFFMIDFNEANNRFEAESKKLEKIINDVSVSTATNTDKINSTIYKCVNIKTENDNSIRFVATDSYRMSTEIMKTNKKIDINVVIEAKSLKKLITKETPKKIFVFFNDSKLGISYKETIIQLNLTNLNYLDTSKLFDFEIKNVIYIDKNELLKIINKAVFMVNEKARRLEFKFSQEGIKLNFEIPEIGSSQAYTNNYLLEGPDFEMDIDFNFLKDALSVLENDKIKINISARYDRLLFISEKDPENKQLITPLRRY